VVQVGTRGITLTATEFRLLEILARRRGRVQSRDRLLQDVWGYENPIDSRTVDTHMRRLREKLGTRRSSSRRCAASATGSPPRGDAPDGRGPDPAGRRPPFRAWRFAWPGSGGLRMAATRMNGSRREIAEQRARREAELREQSQRTSALFDRMVEGLIVVDAGGRIRLANRGRGGLFGFDGAPGKTILEATRHHEVAAVVARLDRELEVLGHELRIDSMAAPRFLQVNALALRDAAGPATGPSSSSTT
jgi:PAS domain-containing protein